MAAHRQNALRIQTPEGVEFSYLLAGPITRSLAWMVDVLIIAALMALASFVLYSAFLIGDDMAAAIQGLLFFVIQLGYSMTLEWLWHGQTVGKKMVKLRVIDAQGLQLQFHQIVLRNLMRFVDALPLFYFVGGLTCLLNRHAQRLGDLAANTVVIRIPEVLQRDTACILAGKFNSLKQFPHLTARLQQRITPHEAMLGFRALQRRDEMDASSRVELFEELAEHYRNAVEFPEEVTEGISDENYVRNVVDVLLGGRSAR